MGPMRGWGQIQRREPSDSQWSNWGELTDVTEPKTGGMACNHGVEASRRTGSRDTALLYVVQLEFSGCALSYWFADCRGHNQTKSFGRFMNQ